MLSLHYLSFLEMVEVVVDLRYHPYLEMVEVEVVVDLRYQPYLEMVEEVVVVVYHLLSSLKVLMV
jgi:hypothetical protein